MMITHWVFNHCKKEKRQARSYWAKKESRLERLLENYRPSLRRLRLTLYHHPARDEWELRAVLYLPTGTLVTEERATTLREVIDAVADGLVREIRRHKGLVRKDHLYHRRRTRREQLSAAGPYLEKDAAESRQRSFVSLLLPHLDQVYDHARRELTILELEGTLPQGEVTPRELMNDVLVRACEAYDERPPRTALDVWLLQLLNARLEELAHRAEPLSLALLPNASPDEVADRDEDNADLDDIQFWMVHLLTPDDPLSIEELLPDEDLSDWLEELSADDLRQRLTAILNECPKPQRQAILLHEAYGFEIPEIAQALNRSEEDIRADLETGRAKLRMNLASVVE